MSAIDEVMDDARGLSHPDYSDAVDELATLRANQLSPAIVAAVRASIALRVGESTIDALVSGGFVRRDTAERVVRALEVYK